MADLPGDALDSSRLFALLETNNALLKNMDARQSAMDARLLNLEMELSELRMHRGQASTYPRASSMTAATSRIVSGPPDPGTPEPFVFRPGKEPATGVRPGLTPATPKVRGASGFIVPTTPRRSRDEENAPTADLHGSTSHRASQATTLAAAEDRQQELDQEYPQLNVNLSAEQRLAATKRASDETSPAVIERKAQLWATCVSNAERDFRGESAEVIIREAEKTMSRTWLEIRRERINRSFDIISPGNSTKPDSRQEYGKPRINQAAVARITKLTHDNFSTWVSEVFALISPIPYAFDILEGVEHGEGYDPADPKKATEKYDAWLDLELGALIGGSVSEECRGYIFSRQTAGETRGSIFWRDLNSIFVRSDGLGKANILEQVISERQRSSEGVRPYAERMRALFIKSASVGAPFGQDDQILYLLRGLHSSFDTARTMIRGFQSQGAPYTFDQALTYLISAEASAKHDQSLGKLPMLSRPTANAASADDTRPYQFRVVGHTKGSPGRFNGECHHCRKYGHKKEDCRQLKRQMDSGEIKPDEAKAHLAHGDEDDAEDEPSFEDAQSDVEGDIYELVGEDGEIIQARLVTGPLGSTARANIATVKTASASKASVDEHATADAKVAAYIPQKAVKAIIDSGATHHFMCMSELLPVKVGAGADAVVHVADGTKAPITRRGACIATLFGDGGTEAEANLKSVLVVPTFTNNLLSVQRLTEEGWTVNFNKHGAELTDPDGKKVQTFTEPGTGAPYVMLKPKPVRVIDIKGSARRIGPARVTAKLVTAKMDQDIKQVFRLHKVMGHASLPTLRTLTKDPAFARPGRPTPQHVAEAILRDQLCDPCIEAKQPLLPFGDGTTMPKAKLSDVHFDLAGPFEGNSEYKYSFQILDAYSRRLWTFPLPNKEAATVFDVFKGWAELMKSQGHGSIKTLHCDHGGEFDNHVFEEWALKNGVSWKWAAPNTSEQNGMIERWNRTIQDCARTMLRAARLSDAFWPYAFKAACDIINRLPTSALGNRIPLTLWTTEPIDYDRDRVFGCLAFAIKPTKTRKNKLTVRAVRGTYLGPAPDHKAYLIYTPSEWPFLRHTRHVIFDETRTYDARFALDEKQTHDGKPGDITQLELPRRKNALSPVPLEVDVTPHGKPEEDWTDEDQEWDTYVTDLMNSEQEKGLSEGNWPLSGDIFGEDDTSEDLVVDEWTGQLNRYSTPEPGPPSVIGIRNSLNTPLSVGDLMDLDAMEALWDQTPTKRKSPKPSLEPPMPIERLQPVSQTGSPAAAVPPRRSARLQGQFKALTAAVQVAFQACTGEARLEKARAFASQVFAASVRSLADGVLIEPKSLHEAKKRPDWARWEQGMQAEIDSLASMKTWILTDLPAGRKAIGCRWTYKLKLDTEGNAVRWKARLVAQGFSQRAGIDYNETFAPVARLTTVRILVALAIRYGLIVWSMDVVTAFLNGFLTEEIFMRQPPHFEDGTGRVCKLLRSLYGLKQSGREWFNVVAEWLIEQLFEALKSEPCVFVKIMPDGEVIIIVLYVDDVLIAAKKQSTVDEIRAAFTKRFKMTDNGHLTQVLGLKIVLNHQAGLATISQQAYIEGMVRRFGLEDANAVSTPMTAAMQALGPRTAGQATAAEIGEYASIIGSLMWVAQGTRPDTAYAVGRLARFMANPKPEHLVGGKHLLRYLKGTSHIGLVYSNQHNAQIEGYSDADHAKDLTTRRSVSGYAFFVYGNLVSWRSRLQASVAISSTESEYVALSEASREAKWLHTLMTEIGIAPLRATDIYTDSSGAYAVARNPEGHGKTKHVDTHHHLVRDLVKWQQVNITQIGTDDNASDIFTKVTPIARLHSSLQQLGLGDNTKAK